MGKRKYLSLVLMLLLLCMAVTAVADAASWKCSYCGRTGNTGNFCPNCGRSKPQDSNWYCTKCGRSNTGNFCTNCGTARTSTTQTTIYGLATKRLAINSGPGTRRYFTELGTYDVKDQYVELLAKAWDPNNSIWWIKVRIPGKNTTGWTGLQRFDQDTFDLDALPTEVWY